MFLKEILVSRLQYAAVINRHVAKKNMIDERILFNRIFIAKHRCYGLKLFTFRQAFRLINKTVLFIKIFIYLFVIYFLLLSPDLSDNIYSNIIRFADIAVYRAV